MFLHQKSQTLKIAYCLPQLTGGADLLQQKTIASGLQSRGHELTFIAPVDLSETVCTRNLQELTLAPRTWSKSAWFTLARKITWTAQKALGIPYLNVFSNYALYDACLQCLPGHNIVQERNGLYKMGVAMACKRLHLPYVLFFDADDLFEHEFLGHPITGILHWRAKKIIQYTLAAARGIVCVSGATKNRLVNVWRVPEEKIAVFPNGVDVHNFQPYPEKRAEVRRSLGLESEPVVTYVGGFYRWHDITTLLEAFVKVLENYPEARLLLVGDGEQRQAMVDRAGFLGIEKSVKFTGSLPNTQIPPLLSATDVAVVPYPKMEQPWWGSSMKLFEYLASGTAVVASDVGEQVTEVIRDGVNGLLAVPGDPDSLASLFMRLIANPGLRAKLGEQARQDAVTKYSWDHYLARLERVYEAVMDDGPIHEI